MDLNQPAAGTLSRRSSHDSDEWVVVNAQGSEIDNIACQTNCELELERRTPDEIVELTAPTENLTEFAEFSTRTLKNNTEEETGDETILRPESFSQEPRVDEISLETIESDLSSVQEPNDETNSQQIVSQLENEISVETGGEDNLLNEETFFADDAISSSCSSDISLMADAAAMQNDENERRVENPADVQNDTEEDFIRKEEVNRRNDASTKNLIIWMAVGVACGVLICHTSLFMKFLVKDNANFLTSPHHAPSTSQSENEALKKYQIDVSELRRQLAACKSSSKEFCERDDKPTCYKSDGVDDDAECKKRLERMESYAKQFDMEHNALLEEVRELQANLSLTVASYVQLTTMKRRESNRLRRKNKRYQIQMNTVNERLESSMKIESTLRRLLAQLESRVNTMKDDLTRVDADRKLYKNLYETCRNEKQTIVDDDDGRQDFSKFFESIKSSTNFDDLLNVTTSFFDDSMNKARDLYENLQKNVDDMKKSTPDVEEYLHRLKHVVVENVGATLSDLWQKAKDVSETLHNDCKSEFGHYCSFFNPYNEEMTEGDDDDRVEIHVDSVDEPMDAESVDEPMDADSVHESTDTESEHESTSCVGDDDRDQSESPHDHFELNNDDESTTSGDETSTTPINDELLESLIKDVKKFRTALKSTNFHMAIDEDDAEQYFGRLKRLFKNSSPINFDEISWWFCQKFWWTNDDVERTTTTNGIDCASKYLPWQTKRSKHYYGKTLASSAKKRSLMRQSKSLTDVLNEFSMDANEKQNDDRSSASNIGSEWFFERWRNRHSIRQNERRGLDESKWIFRRSKERDEWRKSERDKKSERGENRKQRRKRYWGGSWQNFV